MSSASSLSLVGRAVGKAALQGVKWFQYADKKAWALSVVISISANAGLRFHLPTNVSFLEGAPPIAIALLVDYILAYVLLYLKMHVQGGLVWLE